MSESTIASEINDYLTNPESRKRQHTDENYYQMSLEESLDWIMLKAAKFEADRLDKALNKILKN